jgi:YD repeat-containing protein
VLELSDPFFRLPLLRQRPPPEDARSCFPEGKFLRGGQGNGGFGLRLGHVTKHEYDDKGNVVRTTDANGGVTERSYDVRGNTLSEKDPLNRTRTYTYDAQDNRTSETDPLGNTTSCTYNSRNLVLTAFALWQIAQEGIKGEMDKKRKGKAAEERSLQSGGEFSVLSSPLYETRCCGV